MLVDVLEMRYVLAVSFEHFYFFYYSNFFKHIFGKEDKPTTLLQLCNTYLVLKVFSMWMNPGFSTVN